MIRMPNAAAFRLKTLPTGFGSWFAAQLDGPGDQPPSWKIALSVLLGLYPTVMLLTLLTAVAAPVDAGWGWDGKPNKVEPKKKPRPCHHHPKPMENKKL